MSLAHLRSFCRPAWALAPILLLSLGCPADDDGEDVGEDAGDDAAMLPDGCDALVEAGSDDQTAVQEAFIDAGAGLSGHTVCLGAGNFSFTRQLTLDADDVTIKGDSAATTVLDFSGQISGGNGISITGDDVTVTGLTVKNTPGDGIRADQVQNISFIDVVVAWDAEASTANGAYGLYPVQSDGVLIQSCVVYGARDAGIYVGQSTNIVVEDSEAYGNVAGIEIENSTDAQVRRNHAHDNTAGILVFNLPGLDVKDGKRANVFDNIIENNNVPNFGEMGTVVAMVPPGVGVLVLAADDNEIANNEIRGNASVGVGVILYTDSLFPPPNDDAFDIYAQGNFIHDNVFTGNGEAPDELVQLLTGAAMPSPDILFDGCGDPELTGAEEANCISENGAATFMNVDLCGQAGMPSTDPATATCEHTALPRD